ncbi:MAG: phosphoribosylformylglycinamidine cyclo-ligase [Planctomycetes bacterium]|nr:phosphoribosylformylglycinamidine cyclo-ligase [Planctomycetota bacterium]
MSSDQRHDERYLARGVSASKAEVHAAIARQDPGLFPGAFCKVVEDALTGQADHCLIIHADGAGTKSSLAYLAWMEGLGDQVWSGIAQDSLAMNLDDCACVGALGPYLVSNTIGRNAKRIPGKVIAGIVDGYQRMCDLLSDHGIDCRMTGGETADVGDLVRTVIVDSTVTTRLRRADVIDAGRMAPGDVIVGFSSTGQASWEDRPNSGIGSNGLTGARHELLGAGYRTRYPESYAPEVDPALVYCGALSLHDPLPGDVVSVGAALLSPTRTYLPLVKRLLAEVPRADLHGLIHCSGGGQSKIVKFGAHGRPHGNRYVKDALFPVPPLFQAIKDASRQEWAGMYGVYNMGHRLEAIVPGDRAQACIAVASACRIEARVVGRVEDRGAPGNEVVVRTAHGEFRYS